MNKSSKRKRVSHSLKGQLTSLKRENKKLKAALKKQQRENDRLRQTLSATQRGSSPSRFPSGGDIKTPHRALLDEGASVARRYASSTYGKYLFLSLKESTLGRLFRRFIRFFRRLRVVRWVTNIVLIILTAILASAVFITAIPLLLLSTVTALFAVIFNARSANYKMASALAGKHIVILTTHDHTTLGEDSFFERCAKDMATAPNTAVMVISPYLLSTKGLGGRGLYFTARQEAQNLYLVRKSYYFLLRRQVLERIDPHLTVIY